MPKLLFYIYMYCTSLMFYMSTMDNHQWLIVCQLMKQWNWINIHPAGWTHWPNYLWDCSGKHTDCYPLHHFFVTLLLRYISRYWSQNNFSLSVLCPNSVLHQTYYDNYRKRIHIFMNCTHLFLAFCPSLFIPLTTILFGPDEMNRFLESKSSCSVTLHQRADKLHFIAFHSSDPLFKTHPTVHYVLHSQSFVVSIYIF